MKLALTALAASAITTQAAVIFDTTPRDDQAGFAANSGQTWMTATLGSDNLLSTIRVDNRPSSATGTGIYLAVYENNAANGQTWTPGTLVGISTNAQDMDVNGGFALWTFSNETLKDNQRYLFTFTSDSAGAVPVAVETGVRLNTGNSEQSAFNGGSLAFSGSHTMASQITTVPEPSSAVLLGLGGLALILRRRK
ncbi:PEP-CTERM sorting domain-containing protein [Verrucomicrobiaceae bacterium N1E253]|uniref:PEP-CTERM sorting domain-containing protein n=1 Tax=Oceaniferula marina TaxID=2748318 RepID=A0A851GLU4_9BACT|nr:PEP-CTERM sorting domain-containing protein [Oceaniferula marina]NWK56801.1 PEP-CTERM sorting domain-containing protein [Oceaniferula marina]